MDWKDEDFVIYDTCTCAFCKYFRFGIYDFRLVIAGEIITDGKAMDDLRFMRRESWFCFEGHLATPLLRPDVERQGYFYEVRSKRTQLFSPSKSLIIN